VEGIRVLIGTGVSPSHWEGYGQDAVPFPRIFFKFLVQNGTFSSVFVFKQKGKRYHPVPPPTYATEGCRWGS